MDPSRLVSSGMRVSEDAFERDAYRRDLWPRDTLRLADEGARPPAPRLVVWPETTAHVEAALELAARESLAVVPYGAGSGVCGAAAGRAGSLVIDTKRLAHIGKVDPVGRTVEVGAGVLGQHLEDALERQGWMTGHSPSSIACSTVGGYVAARSAGQFSSRYGVFDDMLLAAELVAPVGVRPIGRGAQGPDLLPLVSGSEGSLGVVTKALVRVVPLPEARWLRGYSFPDLDTALVAMRRVLQANLWPSVLRLYDPVDSRIGGRSKAPGEASALRGRISELVAPAARSLMALPLALPELFNKIASGVGEACVLILGFEGPRDLVATQVAAAEPILASGRDLGAGPGERWFAHRHHVSYKLAPIFVEGHFADTMEVAASWSQLARLQSEVRAAIGEHAFVMAHLSHAYPEGCSIYFSFAGRGELGVYDAVWRAGLEAAHAAGGTITHHHGVGQLKRAAAAREIGAAFRLWKEVKAALDPLGLMNPGAPFGDVENPGDEPAAPVGPGPVYAIDRTSLLASLDPDAPLAEVERALASEGFVLRVRPDRPLGAWLRHLERGSLEVWQTPLYAVQGRFPDGRRVRAGRAPRSAAGPDLRWLVLRQTDVEMVEVAIEPLGERVVAHPGHDLRDLRPSDTRDDVVVFRGEAKDMLATVGRRP